MAAKIVLSVFFVLVLFCSKIYAQQHFYKTYGDNGYDSGKDIVQLESDSSFIVIGSSSSASQAPSQVCLLHIDKEGNYLQSYFYGGNKSDIGIRVIHKPGEGYWIAGHSNSFSDQADFDIYLIRLNEDFELVWEKTYGTSDWERLRDAILLPDDGVLLVGEVEGLNTTGKDAFMIRTDEVGEVIWQQTFSGQQDDVLYSCHLFDNNSFVVGGIYGLAEANLWLARFDLDGNVIWSRNDYFSDRIGEVRQVIVTNNRIRFVGRWTPIPFLQNNYRSFQAVCFLDNSVANIVFENGVNDGYVSFCKSEPNVFFGLSEINNFDVVGENGPRGALFKFEGGGYVLQDFSHSIHGFKVQPERIIPTLDSGLIVVGTISDQSYSSGGGNILVLKIDDSVSSLEDVEMNQVVSVDDFYLKSIVFYPNPVKDNLRVLSNSDMLIESVAIYDITGRLFVEMDYSELIDLSRFSAGQYYLQLRTNRGIKTLVISKL